MLKFTINNEKRILNIKMLGSIAKIILYLLVTVSLYAGVWNSPHSDAQMKSETLFAGFSSPPKRLDPVLSYNANEWAIIGQIYEPPLQYNYLKRPYVLEPLTLTQMPTIRYLDENGLEVQEDASTVAFSEYRLDLKKDIKYQNHPAFSKDAVGYLKYASLNEDALQQIHTLDDFKTASTRALSAEDYAYAIKRMAVRENHSPILDNMSQYIVGLEAFSKEISTIAKANKEKGEWLDLRKYAISGVSVPDDHTLTLKIKGKYPQFFLSCFRFLFLAKAKKGKKVVFCSNKSESKWIVLTHK
jgi:ABC-type transport system substrate-binding protein